MENDYYKNLILKYIKEYGHATRKEIIKLLKDKLPESLDDKNKINRIRYLINILKQENLICYDSTRGNSYWILK